MTSGLLNRLGLIVGLLLLYDAIGSMVVQWADPFYPFQLGRLYRVGVGSYMAIHFTYNHGGKRFLDIVIAIVALLCSLPLWVIISLAIYLEDRHAVFFLQERCGKGMRRFNLIKFRSMKVLENEDKHKIVNLAQDERVTKTGKVLRCLSLDSLPELLNVLKGDMSIVGPRVMPYEIEDEDKYTNIEQVPNFNVRSKVTPGMTGLAQVYASKYSDRRTKFHYDSLYVSRVSLWLDMALLVLSVWKSIRGTWE